jgi:hypothetical protein
VERVKAASEVREPQTPLLFASFFFHGSLENRTGQAEALVYF